MKKVTMYQYNKCGSCRQATKTLKNNGYEIDSIELFEHPPDVSTLTELVKQSGLELKKFFNTSGEVYKEMNLKAHLAQMSDEEKIKLLSSNGRLLKRPIVTDGKHVTVGFQADQYQDVWS